MRQPLDRAPSLQRRAKPRQLRRKLYGNRGIAAWVAVFPSGFYRHGNLQRLLACKDRGAGIAYAAAEPPSSRIDENSEF